MCKKEMSYSGGSGYIMVIGRDAAAVPLFPELVSYLDRVGSCGILCAE